MRLALVFLLLGGFLTGSSEASDSPAVDAHAVNAIGYLNCLIVLQNRLNQGQTIDANAELSKQRHGFFPSVEVSGSFGRSDVFTTNSSNLGQATITFDQPLLNLPQLQLIDAAQAGRVFGRLSDLDQVYKQSVSAVPTFFQAISDEESLKVEQARKRQIDQSVDLLDELSRIKSVDQAELYFAQSDQLRVENRIRDLNNQLVNLKSTLAVNASLDSSLSLGRFPESWQPPSARATPNATPDTHNHLEAQAIQYRMSQLSSLEASTSNGILPTLDLSVGYSQNGYPDNPVAPYAGLTGTLNLSWAIYDRSVRNSEASRLAAQRDLQEEVLTQRKAELAVYLRNLQEQLTVAKQDVEKALKKQKLAESAKDLAWTKLRLGRMAYVNYVQYQNNYFDAGNELISAESQRDAILSELYLYDLFSADAPVIENRINQLFCKSQ